MKTFGTFLRNYRNCGAVLNKQLAFIPQIKSTYIAIGVEEFHSGSLGSYSFDGKQWEVKKRTFKLIFSIQVY